MEKRLNDMLDDRLSDDDLRKHYDLSDNRDWQVPKRSQSSKGRQNIR